MIKNLFLGIKNKARSIREFCAKQGFKEEEIAFIGDDLNDIPALEIVRLPIAVNDVADIVRNLVRKKDFQRGN